MKSPEQTKETKTAKELEAMILEDLRNVDGCPDRGVNVTVYGIPWNAMLTFGAAAGPVRNKAELQKFFGIIRNACSDYTIWKICSVLLACHPLCAEPE
jgi:hypothetical protein